MDMQVDGAQRATAIHLEHDSSSGGTTHLHSGRMRRLAGVVSTESNAGSTLQNCMEDIDPNLEIQMRQRVEDSYPNMRGHIKQMLEADIKRRFDLSINAEQVYLNAFPKGLRLPCSSGGWKYQALPRESISLVDLYMDHRKRKLLHDPGQYDVGLYVEGRWAASYGRHNVASLTVAQLAQVNLTVQPSYKPLIQAFWDQHQDTVRALAEIDVLRYVQAHRRADARAQAIGLIFDSSQPALSGEAIAMIAHAAGRGDPDATDLTTQVYGVDIVGYLSPSMAWMQSGSGRVVLLIPNDVPRFREFSSLAAMRAHIREMTKTAAGRAILIRNFNPGDVPDGIFLTGVLTWLDTIAQGHSDDVIASRRRAYTGDIARWLRPADERLLSDQALAMLSEAAGYAEADGGHGTTAAFLDIDGEAAKDIVVLSAANGLIVLVFPGEERLVREYRNLDQMRADIAAMTHDEAGRQRLASHFSLWDRIDVGEVAGVNTHIAAIGAGGSAAMIGKRMRAIDDNVFARQAVRTGYTDIKDLELDLGLRAHWLQVVDIWPEWLRAHADYNPLFVRATKAATTAAINTATESASSLSRARRSPLDRLMRSCRNLGQAPRRWISNLRARLRRVDAHPLTPMGSRSPSPMVAVREQVVAPSSTCDGARRVEREVAVNTLGFRERVNMPLLYRIESDDVPVSERVGLNANDNADFINTRTMDGDVVDAYLTREAAMQALYQRGGIGRFRVLEIRAYGLRAVSFGDNRARNADFPTLHRQLQDQLANAVLPGIAGISRRRWENFSPYAEDLVYLNLDGMRPERVNIVGHLYLAYGRQQVNVAPAA